MPSPESSPDITSVLAAASRRTQDEASAKSRDADDGAKRSSSGASHVREEGVKLKHAADSLRKDPTALPAEVAELYLNAALRFLDFCALEEAQPERAKQTALTYHQVRPVRNTRLPLLHPLLLPFLTGCALQTAKMLESTARYCLENLLSKLGGIW